MVTGKATQNFVPIQEVRDGVVILKDGSLRGILMASSVNLELKSEDEQKAVIMEFQSFLNSLEFQIQICAQSRHIDIRPYINSLKERLEQQKEDLLRTQTQEYIGFIQWFTETTDIMTKSFYLVIPYNITMGSNTSGGILSSLPFFNNQSGSSNKTESEVFEEKRNQLQQRMGVVQQGLSGMGVRATELGTQEAIEVYYRIFNPGETERSVPETET